MPPSRAAVSSSDSTILLAAAAAAPSGRGIAGGIVVAAVSQLGWGCYPVFARAMQTQEPRLSIVELLVGLNSISATVLAASALASRLLRLLRRRCGHSVAPAAAASAITAGGSCTLSWRHVRLVAFFGAVIAVRAVTNIASAAYAPAHWCVMLALCTPVCTSAIGKFIFGDPLPAGTVPALLLGLAGSALAIFGGGGGGAAEDSSGSGGGSSVGSVGSGGGGGGGGGGDAVAMAAPDSDVALGIGLALISTVALAIYQHCVKRTKGILSAHAVR